MITAAIGWRERAMNRPCSFAVAGQAIAARDGAQSGNERTVCERVACLDVSDR